MKWYYRFWIISAILNLILGGKYPETMSSRCFRRRHHWWYRIWYRVWNGIFRNRTHCAESYLAWRKRMEHQLGLPLPPLVVCMNCGLRTFEPIMVCRHVGTTTEQFSFCSDKCHEAYYLNRLRKEGL